MAIDLTGGLDEAREYVFETPPTEPGMRDAVNMWLWDDSGWIGIPRVGVEAIAPDWDEHTIQATVVLADGRVMRHYDPGKAHPVAGKDGKPLVFGAGPMSFECVEPFKRYVARYEGDMIVTDYDTLLHRQPPKGKSRVAWEITCENIAPPWVQGTMSKDAADMLSGTREADFMGGDRLEQVMKAEGWVEIDGERRPFKGGGLRVKRQGVRKVEGFWGHCWQSATFPSGRAFGINSYPPPPGGEATYNEGYVFLGDGAIKPASAEQAPYLSHMAFSGEDAGLTLDTPDGPVRIEARTVMSIPSLSTGKPQKMVDGINFPPLLQSIVRYEWDGEVGYGMMERSNLPERVSGIPEPVE